MALIEVFHVVASNYDVDPNHDAVGQPIVEGQFVALNSDAYVTQSNGNSEITQRPIGLAGDTIATDQGYTPYAADIVISGSGSTRSTSNRVSDFFDETRGSSKITVYHGGGEFWTDQYATGQNWEKGGTCYVDSTGLLTMTDPGSGREVGRCITGPSDYPSGVPGVDVEGSISLGQFVRFQLVL